MADQILTPPSDGTEQTWEVRFNAAERRYTRMKGLVSAALEKLKITQAENDSLKLANHNIPTDTVMSTEPMDGNTPPQQKLLQAKYADAVAKMKMYQSSIQAIELLYAKDRSMRDDLFDYEEHRHESNEVIAALCRMLKTAAPPSLKCMGCKEKMDRLQQMAKGSGMIQVLAADRRVFVFGYYAHRVEPVEQKLCQVEACMEVMKIRIMKYEQEYNTNSAAIDQHTLNALKTKIIAKEKELKSNTERNDKLANEVKIKEIQVKITQSRLDDLSTKCAETESRFSKAKATEEELMKKYSGFNADEVYSRLQELKHKAEEAEAESSLLEYRVRTAKAASAANAKKLTEMQEAVDTGMIGLGSLSINSQ